MTASKASMLKRGSSSPPPLLFAHETKRQKWRGSLLPSEEHYVEVAAVSEFSIAIEK